MSKTDIVDYVLEHSHTVSKMQALAILEIMIDGMKESIKRGEDIYLRNFCTIRPCLLQPRRSYLFSDGKNLKRGVLPLRKAAKIKLSTNFQKELNDTCRYYKKIQHTDAEEANRP